jgi:hypothetical protein
LNTFYLQANIGDRQTYFIPSKVVNSLPSKLFTAQERTAEINDMLIAVPDIMWGYYQQLELEGHLDALTTCCREHG